MTVYETSRAFARALNSCHLPSETTSNGATDHFDRRLVVDCVRRNRQTCRPDLCGGHRVVWHRLVVQVREHCEVDEAQRSVVTGGDWAQAHLALQTPSGSAGRISFARFASLVPGQRQGSLPNTGPVQGATIPRQ